MGWSRSFVFTVAGTLLVGGAVFLVVLMEPSGSADPLPPLPSPPRRVPLSVPVSVPTSSASVTEPQPSGSVTKTQPGYVDETLLLCRMATERPTTRAVISPLLAARPSRTESFGLLTAEHADGGLRAMRLSGIGTSTVLARLGFEDGDLIRTINGFPMNDLERLRTSNALDILSVIVERRGVRQCLEFRLD